MSSKLSDVFHVQELILPAVYPRSERRSTQRSSDRLEISAKLYFPKNNPSPQPGDVTLVSSHGNGFHKELYEPLFIDIVNLSETQNIKIRQIFIADVVNQGASGIKNEAKLGDLFDWLDNARDIYLAIQQLNMPQPIIALGHSMGGAILFYLSAYNPNLFISLIGLDPMIETKEDYRGEEIARLLSSRRRDKWPSLEAVKKSYANNNFFKFWDPRVLDRFFEFGFINTPTKLYPTPETKDEVTLATTKLNETFLFVSDVYDFEIGKIARKETNEIYASLAKIQVPVLLVIGSKSAVYMNNEKRMRQMKTEVELAVIKDGSHSFPLERVLETATIVVPYIKKSIDNWKEQEYLDSNSRRNDTSFSDVYVKQFGLNKSKL
ncbi:Alpha/Beta hydrolase protein [Lipomyces japonicus]|uniref:Alpha/Beta hydrolase protein n=1 Tax=Lipomyces japonicus TaxID=56871 RepID=UPI0034CD9F8A